MKLLKIIQIAFLLYITIAAKAGTPVASIVFSNPVESNKITHPFSTTSTSESYTFQSTKGGESCRQIPASKYGYFRVDDVVIPSTQNNLIVNITFFDEGTSKINFMYNANDGNNYKSLSVQQSGTNNWITAKIIIANASFRNAQNNTSDFRVNASSGDIYIREISIEVGTLSPESETFPVVSASSYSEFLGKSVAGYQAWFTAGSLTSGWLHWNSNTSGAPGPNTSHFEVCPDISEYPEAVLKPTNLAPMGNGTPFKLFTSSEQSVMDVHMKWMKDYGIDGVAVQRFLNNIGGSIIKSPNAPILKIKQAAETNQRIFYICYDTSSGLADTWDDVIKMDWVYNVEQNDLTKSPAYAKVGNKPVVQIWGLGFASDGKNPGTSAEAIALIEFLQSRGCYVIGGVPRGWRTNNGDARGPSQALPINQESYENVYVKLNMISPWMPGRIRDNTSADNLYNTVMIPDKSYCDARNIQYMPVNHPGFAWSQWNNGDVNPTPRNAGEFMWRQSINIKKLGVQNMYFAMFDEYDEGTAIMKNATDWSMIPTNQYFLTSSADGLWCSSDFQLRVAGASVQLLKGQRTLTTNVPVPHSNGPVYYRNSFEKRTTVYNYVDNVATKSGTFNIDPCFYQNAVVLQSNVLSPVCEIQTTNPRSGLYSVKASGTIGTVSASRYIYKVATTKIAIKPDMSISFWKRTEDELGRYVFVDLRTKNGNYLKNVALDQNGVSMNPTTPHGTVGAGWEKFSCNFGKNTLLGDTITEMYINFDKSVALTGTYTAYFDDFLIEEPVSLTDDKAVLETNVFSLSQNPTNITISLKTNEAETYLLQFFDISGKKLIHRTGNKSTEIIKLNNYGSGVYILNLTINAKKYYQKIVI